jgi:hypothetical protein
MRHPLADRAPCPVLQYADDTLVLRGEPEDVQSLKVIQDNFAAAQLQQDHGSSNSYESKAAQCISILGLVWLHTNLPQFTWFGSLPNHVDYGEFVYSQTKALGCRRESFPRRPGVTSFCAQAPSWGLLAVH